MGRMLAASVFFFCGTVWAVAPQTHTIEVEEVSDYNTDGFNIRRRINAGGWTLNNNVLGTTQYTADLYDGDTITVWASENGTANYDLHLYDPLSNLVASSTEPSYVYEVDGWVVDDVVLGPIAYKVGSGVGELHVLQVNRVIDENGSGYTLSTYVNGELFNVEQRNGPWQETVVLYPGDVYEAELYSWGEANYDLYLFDSDGHPVATSTSADMLDAITYPPSGGGGGGECGGGAATLFVALAFLARAVRRRRA